MHLFLFRNFFVTLYISAVCTSFRWHSFNPKHAHANPCGRNTEANTWLKNKDGTLQYSNLERSYLCALTPEKLSNQHRSIKIGGGVETKETELEVLQRERNKGVKDWWSGGRRIMSGVLLELLVKDKLPHSREVPVKRKNGSWNPWGEREKITAEKYPWTRTNGSWKWKFHANMATLATPTCSTCS